MITNEHLLKELKDYKEMTDNELEKEVISIILDEGEDYPVEYISDVMSYGCVSGYVTALISYNDTREFFAKHFEDIFKVYNNYIREGYDFSKKELDSNSLAWLGFEGVIKMLYYKFMDK